MWFQQSPSYSSCHSCSSPIVCSLTHLLHELVVSGLVEEDEVVELVPRLALRPLLLLGFPATPALLLLRRLGRSL